MSQTEFSILPGTDRSLDGPDNLLVTCQILNVIPEFRTKKYPARMQSQWSAESLQNLDCSWDDCWGCRLCPHDLVSLDLHMCLEQGTLVPHLVWRIITCAFWETVFVPFVGFWLINWAFLTTEKPFFILLLKILAPKIYQTLLYFQNIWKRILKFFFSSNFISDYNIGGIINTLWLNPPGLFPWWASRFLNIYFCEQLTVKLYN